MARIVISPMKVTPGCVCIFGCVQLFMFAAVQRACRPSPPSVTCGDVMPSDRDPLTVSETRYQRNTIRSTLFWCFLALSQQQYHYYVNANWNENCRPMKNVKMYLCLIEDDAISIWWNGDIAPHIPTTATREDSCLAALLFEKIIKVR
jgi:hypothetical protein